MAVDPQGGGGLPRGLGREELLHPSDADLRERHRGDFNHLDFADGRGLNAECGVAAFAVYRAARVVRDPRL